MPSPAGRTGATTVRSRPSILKAAGMGASGVFVLARAAWASSTGVAPEPMGMGAVGLLALRPMSPLPGALGGSMLYRHRTGDCNAHSVSICSRNDAVGTVAIVLAAGGRVWHRIRLTELGRRGPHGDPCNLGCDNGAATSS
jgi:hypothetical protein